MFTDLLTKIKNAETVHKNRVVSPHNKMDMAIAEILAQNGFLKEVEKKGRNKKYIEAKLGGNINGIKFLSRPSRHIYSSYKNLRPVRGGYGIRVISTSRGIMTTREARRLKLGGELLFEIW